MSAPNILRINSSARKDGSLSRELSSLLADALAGETGNVVVRDLADRPVPQVDADWVGANFTDPSERSEHNGERLGSSGYLRSIIK